MTKNNSSLNWSWSTWNEHLTSKHGWQKQISFSRHSLLITNEITHHLIQCIMWKKRFGSFSVAAPQSYQRHVGLVMKINLNRINVVWYRCEKKKHCSLHVLHSYFTPIMPLIAILFQSESSSCRDHNGQLKREYETWTRETENFNRIRDKLRPISFQICFSHGH